MDGEIIIGTRLDTKQFDAQIKEVEWELKQIDDELKDAKKLRLDTRTMNEMNLKAEKLRNKLIDLNEQKEKLNSPEPVKWTEDFGSSLSKSIKKISRLVLGVFGIRSAYLAVRSAMNTLTENDEQLKADIEYMKGALAYALEPVVRAIVNLMKQLLTYIGAIIYMWTGKNIFENANKSLNSANKEAKKLAKTLAPFDEMTILQDTSGAKGGGAETPSFDLTNLDDAIKRIEDIENRWNDFGEEMRTSLFDMPFEVWTKAFGDWDLAIYGVTLAVYGLWEMVTGFFQFFKGIAEIIYGIITGDTEMIKKGFKDLLDAIIKGIKGIYDFGTGLAGAFVGVIKALFQKFWNGTIEDINNLKNKIETKFTDIVNSIKGKINELKTWLTDTFGVIGTAIGNVIGKSITGILNSILGFAEGTVNGFLRSINGAISIVNKIPGVDLKKISLVSFPRLAKGGIVNMPGRGVPVGNAIAGERGAEGVIPLTDSQQMALLGEAIGKYININATVPVYVGNRQIAREIRKIEAENDFAYNR